MYICIYVYMYICEYVYVYMYICIYVYMCICVYMYVYTCIYIYIHTHTHIERERTALACLTASLFCQILLCQNARYRTVPELSQI